MAALEQQAGVEGTIVTKLLTGHTGVKITGVRVPELTDAQIDEVRHLVSTYCVGVFPGQHLSPEKQLAFLRRFAPLQTTPGNDPHPDYPDVQVVKSRGTGQASTSGPFHTDTCFVNRPPSYSSLNGIEVPEHGGDTVFLNQYLAYEMLSERMKDWLSGLRLKHVVTGTERPEEVPNPVWHPAVRTNPVTGRKSLYVTMPVRCIEAEGLTSEESTMLISFLYTHSQQLHGMYRHRWQAGDLVMWDNRCSLHAAVYDQGDQPRKLYRVMCEGEKPQH